MWLRSTLCRWWKVSVPSLKELVYFLFLSIPNNSVGIDYCGSGCMHFEGDKYAWLKFIQEEKTLQTYVNIYLTISFSQSLEVQ